MQGSPSAASSALKAHAIEMEAPLPGNSGILCQNGAKRSETEADVLEVGMV